MYSLYLISSAMRSNSSVTVALGASARQLDRRAPNSASGRAARPLNCGQKGEASPRARSITTAEAEVLAVRAAVCNEPTVFSPMPRGGRLITRSSEISSEGLCTSRK